MLKIKCNLFCTLISCIFEPILVVNVCNFLTVSFLLEPTLSSIQVLSKSSRNAHTLNVSHRSNSDDSDDDDDEVEIIEEHGLLSNCLSILNKPKKVGKWLTFLECNMNNDEVLVSFINWCHNLLLIYKDSIRKYL